MSWLGVPRTLRARLTVWHVSVVVLVLALYAAVVLLLVTRNLSRSLDARLRSDFRWAAEMAQQGPDGSLSWFEGDPWSADSPWLRVWTPAGQAIYQTEVARRLPVPQSSALVTGADGQIVSVSARPAPFRMLAGPATVGGRPVVLQVGRSEAIMRLEVRELALVFLLGLPLTVVVAGVGGYLLARGALAPLHRMAERAQDITAHRLSERLPIDNPHDELGRLASVFNDTLARLESSFKQMRRFTGNVSHELRTPLTAIRSVGEVSLREPRDASSYRRVIESMLEETDRLTSLVDRLLMVSRADHGDRTLALEPIDLRALADEVAAHLDVLAEEKQQSMSVEQTGQPRCRGDRITLRHAVINLVDNAIRYTPVGGQIRLRVSASPDNAVLEVHDTGPGIPEGDQARLFDRLYRGRDSAPGGSGLGLSIARWAVEANHGQLSYAHQVNGSGSTFRITLPAVATSVSDAPTVS
jgi:heavy metal sensor kinase